MVTSTRSVLAPSDLAPQRPVDRPSLGRPLFLLNLKAYPGCLGPGADRIARMLEEMGKAAGVAVAIAPAAPDLGRLSSAVSIPVLAQHVDALEAGAHTGFVPPEAVEKSGGWGSLVNHSEHPLTATTVQETVRRLSALGLVAVVCAKDVRTAGRLAETRPGYLAVEPPELIGGQRSVSTAAPEVVSGSVEAVRKVSPSTIVLCGAGVHDRRDVQRAIELGSEGVLVASAVTRAPDPRAALAELLTGF
jgi:triosephosphate isomerase (TIM)